MYKYAPKNHVLSRFTDLQCEYMKSPIYTNGRVNPKGFDYAALACVVINECKAIIEDCLP